MRIVVHGQQAFGKAVLEALLKRGENVVAVYVAPEKPGAKADPLKEAALAAKLPVYQPASYKQARRSGTSSRRSSPTCRSWPSSRCSCRRNSSTSRPTARSSIIPRCCRPIAAPVRHQLADHQGREGNRPVDLLARQRPRYRRRAAAEEDADLRHRHARHGLFRPPVPDGRRGHAGVGRSGEGRQGAAHQAGRVEGDLRRPLRPRQRAASTGASPGSRSTG